MSAHTARVRARRVAATLLSITIALMLHDELEAQRTMKPVLHGRHWVAITGKPLDRKSVV